MSYRGSFTYELKVKFFSSSSHLPAFVL